MSRTFFILFKVSQIGFRLSCGAWIIYHYFPAFVNKFFANFKNFLMDSKSCVTLLFPPTRCRRRALQGPPSASCGRKQKSYTRFRIHQKVFKIREKLVDKGREIVIYYPSTTREAKADLRNFKKNEKSS